MSISDTFRSVCGELFCTFLFVSTILAMCINSNRVDDAILATLIVPGLVAGAIAIVLIYIFADISGAHFNPGITFGFLVTGKIPMVKGLLYIVAQLAGGVLATLLQYVIFPNNISSGPTISESIVVSKPPGVSVVHGVFMEIFLTFVLVYAVFASVVDSLPDPPVIYVTTDVEDGQKSTLIPAQHVHKRSMCPLIIGLTIGLLCYLGSTSSGGCFNIARAFGPALVTFQWRSHWIYWVGDLIGGGLAAFIHTFVFARNDSILSVQ